MIMFKHSVAIKWSDEDNGFIAFSPELEGLSAFGLTQDEAVKELLVAAEAFIETLKESGQDIPTPGKILPYSGQLRLRLPKWLHANLAMEAENEGVSLNTHLVSLLAKRHGEHEIMSDLVKHTIDTFNNQLQQAPYRIEAHGNNWTNKQAEEQQPSKVINLYLKAVGGNDL
jgi:predicted RNase H-like HicB family nuclease